VGEMAYKVCVDKLKSLGIEFTPIKESLKDTVVSLKERCLLIWSLTWTPCHIFIFLVIF